MTTPSVYGHVAVPRLAVSRTRIRQVLIRVAGEDLVTLVNPLEGK